MEHHPPKAYAAIISLYLAILGLIATLIQRRRHVLEETPPARDLAMIGVATFRLSRLIAYDRITSVLRSPFVEQGKGYVQIEGTQEEAKGTGLRRAIGQLLTCSWCVSIWAGTFNVGIYTLVPRLGRLLLMILMASGISELLDPVFPLLNFLAGYIQRKEQQLQQEESSELSL